MTGHTPGGGGRGGASLGRESVRVLRDLLAVIDAQTAARYAEHGAGQLRPRFTAAMIALSRAGPMTVRELAHQIEVTHSAASQSVAAMRAQDLVWSTAGTDARTQVVTLTGRGRELVPFLEAERSAAEDVWARLDAELVCPIADVVSDLSAALDRRSFLQRLREHDDDLAADAPKT